MRKDLTGIKFGCLTVLKYIRKNPKFGTWECLCDCGKTTHADASFLTGKRKGSKVRNICWCDRRKTQSEVRKTHGNSMIGSKNYREYTIWCAMKERCYNPKVDMYPSYGGRGISVYEEWRHSFESFLAHIGPRPSSNYSIDRIDVNGNYEPGNVRWATTIEQGANKRSNRMISYEGTTLTVTQWARKTGINVETLRRRLFNHGWTVGESLTTPTLRRNPKNGVLASSVGEIAQN